MVVVDLVQDAAAAGGERAVVHARRPAGVGGREALLAALALLVVAHHEVALHHVDLLPMVVDEGLGGESAGLDLQEPRAAAGLRLLVEVGGEDLLVEARRITFRGLPSGRQVDLHELQVLLRFHAASASCSRNSSMATARSPLASRSSASLRNSRKRLASRRSKRMSLMRRW